MRTTPYETDEKGEVIDPPIIQEYEDKIAAASHTADTDLLESIQEEYAGKRKDLAKRTNDRLARESRSTTTGDGGGKGKGKGKGAKS